MLRLCTPILLLIFTLLFPLVDAHGSVSAFSANGQTWNGPMPGSRTDQDSPVRVISTLEPIMDPNSKSMACGPGVADNAQVIAEVTAGTPVTYAWRSGAGMDWVHRWGPVLLYAYQCPGSAADCQPPDDKQWFLIDAAAADPNASDFEDSTGWMQDRFEHGKSVDAKVPRNMPNGDYLLRHEIIALHNAMSNGAEYYVSCTQVKVTGGISGTPKDAGAELVAFPGAYGREDPGIRVNVFGMNIKDYKMPGPAVFGSDNVPPGSDTPPSNTNSTDSPSPTDSPLPAATKKPFCRLRKPASSLIQAHERRRALLGFLPTRSLRI